MWTGGRRIRRLWSAAAVISTRQEPMLGKPQADSLVIPFPSPTVSIAPFLCLLSRLVPVFSPYIPCLRHDHHDGRIHPCCSNHQRALFHYSSLLILSSPHKTKNQHSSIHSSIHPIRKFTMHKDRGNWDFEWAGYWMERAGAEKNIDKGRKGSSQHQYLFPSIIIARTTTTSALYAQIAQLRMSYRKIEPFTCLFEYRYEAHGVKGPLHESSKHSFSFMHVSRRRRMNKHISL